MTHPARPTIRCLLEDLAEGWTGAIGRRLRAGTLPPPSEPLDRLEHPLLAQARQQFSSDIEYPTERIDQLDDRVWLKVKTNSARWRGAVHVLDDRPWIGAAGWREAGSRDDFYDELVRSARGKARGSHSPNRSDTQWLLPVELDHARLRVEQQYHAEYVEPVLALRELLRAARQHQRVWQEARVGGDRVCARIEQDEFGHLYLELEPGPARGVHHAIQILLGPLTSGDWDLETVGPDGRLLYFTLLEADVLAAALGWQP